MAAENELDPQGREPVTGPGTDGDSTTGQQQPAGQPTTNLDDDPRFREWKSNMDRRINQLATQAERERAARAEIERQREEQYVATLNEVDKANYLRQQAEQEAAVLRKQMEDERQAIQKLRVLDEVSRMEGVPVEVIQGANDVMEAWRLAKQYNAQHNQGYQQQPQGQYQQAQSLTGYTQASPPPVDMGGGRRPPQDVDSLQRQYDQAAKEFDTGAMLDIMAEADKVGVTIREY